MAFEPHIDSTAANILASAGGDIARSFWTAYNAARKNKDEEDLQGGHVAAAVKEGVMEPDMLEKFTSGNRGKKLELGSEAQLLLQQHAADKEREPMQLTPDEQQAYTNAGYIPVRTSRGGFQAVQDPTRSPATDPSQTSVVNVGDQRFLLTSPHVNATAVTDPAAKLRPPFQPSQDDMEWAKQNGMRFMPQSATGAGSWVRGSAAPAAPEMMDITLPDGRTVRGTVNKAGFKAVPGQTGTGKGAISPEDKAADAGAQEYYKLQGQPPLDALQARRKEILAGMTKWGPDKAAAFPGDLPTDLTIGGTLKRLNREIEKRSAPGVRAPAPAGRPAPASSSTINNPAMPTGDPMQDAPIVGAPQGGIDTNAQALAWARSHPDDPRSGAILQKLGVLQ